MIQIRDEILFLFISRSIEYETNKSRVFFFFAIIRILLYEYFRSVCVYLVYLVRGICTGTQWLRVNIKTVRYPTTDRCLTSANFHRNSKNVLASDANRFQSIIHYRFSCIRRASITDSSSIKTFIRLFTYIFTYACNPYVIDWSVKKERQVELHHK